MAELVLVRSMLARITLAMLAVVITVTNQSLAKDLVAQAVFGSDSALETFKAAEHVTVARMHKRPWEETSKDEKIRSLYSEDPSSPIHTLPFYRLDAAAPVSADDVRTLKKLFTDPNSYQWNSEKGIVKACEPDYGVLFTFRGRSGVVRIALCFHCDQMGVLLGEGEDPLRYNAEEDFDLMRGQLLTLVKRLFPNDSAIQSLPLERKT